MNDRPFPITEADTPQLHAQDVNLLRAVRFERPDTIPMTFHINDACWHHYPQDALNQLMAEHQFLFPDYQPFEDNFTPDYLPNARVGQPYTDPWGCVWESTDNGIVGTVTHHPLADWANLENYTPPDPTHGDGMGNYLGSALYDATNQYRRLKKASLRHGHTFLQLCDLRGYENLMFDMADDEPRLWQLIEMVEQFNLALIHRDLDAGARWMGYPEDLGMQLGPMIAPVHFRKYIQPVYRRLMAPARDIDCVVHMHCDGQLHTMIEDIIESGVEVLNLQDHVNGIDWIAEHVKGRICIDLDIDRQDTTVNGTPADIDALIRREVEQLGSKEGGLTMIYGMYPGTPLENAHAVADAMERYAGHFSG